MNSDKPRISVIVPAYNVEQYIEAALDSVFAQDVPAYEVIVVNDGSTDSTADKIAQYAHRPELQVITTENTGLGPARNTGVQYASGEYIYFFDSDDLMDRRLIAVIQSHVEKHDATELILFSADAFCDPGAPEEGWDDYTRGFEMVNATGEQALKRMARTGKIMPSACMYVVERRFWGKGNFCFKSIVHEDEELFLSLVLAADRVIVLDDVLFFRRVRPMSIMTSPRTQKNIHAYLVIANSSSELYRCSRHRPADVQKIIKKHADQYVKYYICLGIQLEEILDWKAVLIIARRMWSLKTFRRMVWFYFYSMINNK